MAEIRPEFSLRGCRFDVVWLGNPKLRCAIAGIRPDRRYDRRMPTELSWPALLTQLLAGADLIDRRHLGMEEVMAGRATPPSSPGSWSPCGPRGRPSTRSSASGTRFSRTPCRSRRPPRARHRRHGRRPVRHGQRLHDVVDRRRGAGAPRRQARQQGGQLRLRLVGCARRARRRPRSLPRARRAGARRDRHHLRVRGALPPRLPARRARCAPSSASRLSSTSSDRSATPPVPRRRRSASPRSTRCRSSSACSRRAARPRWCSAATTGSTSSRRPATATSGRCRAAR